MSPHGQVRLWETVSLSLSGVDRYRSATLAGFESSGGGLEVVRSLQALSPTCFLATTTSATRFYVITVNSVAGRTELGTRVVEKNVGWASSILSSVFGGSTTTSSAASSAFSRTGGGAGGILSLAVSHASRGGGGGAGEERVYAVLDKTAHAWNVSTNGAGERLVGSEIDVFAGVLEALEGRKVGNEQWAMNEGRVEIVDAGVTAKGELALLVSHASAQTTPGFQSWAIVLLNIVGTIVEVSGITRLSYQSVRFSIRLCPLLTSSGRRRDDRNDNVLNFDDSAAQISDRIRVLCRLRNCPSRAVEWATVSAKSRRPRSSYSPMLS